MSREIHYKYLHVFDFFFNVFFFITSIIGNYMELLEDIEEYSKEKEIDDVVHI